MKETKPGYQTTEFWLTTAAILVGIVFDSGAVIEGSPLGEGLGLVAAALSIAGYSVSRGIAKR